MPPQGKGDRKTRTTSAHGPTTAKKAYKPTPTSTSKPPTTTKTRTSSATTPSNDNGKKRKHDSSSEIQPERPPREIPSVMSSLLNAPEEVDFPRGGGTGLKQVEVKEAMLEGEMEAKALEDADDEEVKRLNTEVPEKSKSKRRKLEREALNARLASKKEVIPKDAFRIENLNYKRLVPGTKVLAQIVKILPLELIVSLPNQLLGHIPITRISAEYTSRLEQEDEEDSDSEDSEDSEDEDSEDGEKKSSSLPTLAHLFKLNDYLPTIVITRSETDNSKVKSGSGSRSNDELWRSSRRVELSTEPEKVNEGIARGDLKAGFIITASVKSIEDHGYSLSLGLPTLSAFLSFLDAKKLQSSSLVVGQLVRCRIKDVGENGRTCTVTVGKEEVRSGTLQTSTSITSILPTTLVPATITHILPTGLNLKFHGFFSATVSLFHIPPPSTTTSTNEKGSAIHTIETLEEAYKVGAKVKARVLFDNPGTEKRVFGASLLPHLVSLSPPSSSASSSSTSSASKEGKEREGGLESKGLKVGMKMPVRIGGVEEDWGLRVDFESPVGGEGIGRRIPGFVHISNITDSHLSSIPKSSPWKISTIHEARVVGYSAVDDLVQLSLQPSVLEKKFLRVEDVRVGEVIKGTIKRLSDTALFVDIGGNVDGVVWPIHYSDIKLKHPEKKFLPGGKVTARVYSTDTEKHRVVLTLKKQLVNESDYPILTCIKEAKSGMVTLGTVSKVLEKGILVDFFGGLRGLVGAGEAAENFTTSSDLQRLFPVGKVLPVKLLSIDTSSSRITASIRQALPSATPSIPLPSVEIGTTTTGTITDLHESNIVLQLEPSGVKALISFSTLARNRKTTVEELRTSLVVGAKIEKLVVVSKNDEKGFVIVGLVPSKSSSSVPASKSSDITFENLKVGDKYNGKIAGKVPTGLLVQLSRSVRGRVPRTEVSDDYDLVDIEIGKEVECIVLSVDEEYKRVDLSLRASKLGGGEGKKVKDVVVENVGDVKPGQEIRGFVKNVANHGLFVSLGAEVTARVQIKELFDEYIKEWKPKFSIGQLVTGKILSVDKSQNQVEMSLRKGATVKEATIDFGDLEKGQIVNGVVKKVEAYGCFIRIEGSTVSGLCHKSKISDDENAAWTEMVHPGDKVKAIITDIDTEKKKISLGLKHSLFPEGALDNDDDDEDDEDEDEDNVEEDDEMAEVEDEDDDEDVLAQLQKNGLVDIDVNMEDEVESDVDVPLDNTKKPATPAIKPLNIGAGFKWTGEDESEEEEANGAVESESEVEDANAEPAKRKHRKDLSTLEDRTGDLDTQAPATVGDFERLLLGSPNSSYLWIQYIAFFVGLSQLDKAREIGRRALRTINFREEAEKLNVWVALLNLENSYGTPESLEELFKEAAQSNDSKTVHLRLIDIYERAGKYQEEEELFQRTVKKFGQSSKAWTLFGQYYLTRGRATEARDLLPRSLKSLEKRKHVKTISKFAQLEFKLGDAERGRTIFEGIVDSYPKRLDLWFVYIDMEIKQRNVAGVRSLFERVLAQKLSSKKGKSVFKKWLSFEKELGDAAGVEACKQRALEFVESLS